jgi:hypothetical protein
MVDERDPRAGRRPGDDLVPENGAGVGRVSELLDVGAAQAAGEHPDELSRSFRLRHVGEHRLAAGA